MRKHSALVAFLVLALVASACTTTGTASVKTFDHQAFTTLLVAQAAIEQAKTEAAGTQYAHQVNEVIARYNQAYETYKAFHASVEIGTNTNSTDLKNQLVALLEEIAKLRQALGKNGGPTT